MRSEQKRVRPIRRKAIKAVASFVALVHANENGDAKKSQAAQIELARLGFRVDFGKAVQQ